jgi:hypothetical protein
LLEFFQTFSNKKFNGAFQTMLNTYKLWGTGTAGDVHFISDAVIYRKALELYEELANVKQWIKMTPPKGAALVTAGDKTSSEDGSDKKAPLFPDLTKRKQDINSKVQAGLMSMEEGQAAKKLIEKEKKARRKKTDKATTDGTAMVAATPPSNNNGDKTKQFTVNNIKVKGDTSRPKDGDHDKPRTFTKVDGSGTIELWWCRIHGTYGGQWQDHKTSDCPNLRNGGTSSGGGSGTPGQHMAASPGVTWADANSYAKQLRRNNGRG